MMRIKIGIDLGKRKRFMESLKKGKESFLNRIFTPQELRQNTKEQLASIFCLKEALIKALELPYDSWLIISTNRKINGKIDCSFIDQKIAKNIISLDTSISHEAGLIIGVAVIISKS